MNGKVYVGSAVNLSKRWYEHLWALRRGKHTNPKFQNAWNKYGETSFKHLILEIISNISKLIKREQYWIEKMEAVGNSGYNINPTAGSQLGAKRTKESCERMSVAGKKRGPISEETRAKLKARVWSAETIAKRTGWHHSDEEKERISFRSRNCSEETRRKMGDSSRGRKHTPEACAKIGAAHKGMKHTEEAKKKMSLSHTGKKLSAEHKAKLSEASRNMSFETKAKMSKTRTGMKLSDETKAKISASHIRRREILMVTI